MQIICISRGSYGYSSEVMEKLSEKTGYAIISREEITDKATEFGIPIGKLEMMILKNQPMTEEMSIVMDMFKAFATAYICDKASKESVIYHGRTGHLLLPGLANVLRIRAIADMEYRIRMVINRLNLDREKAKDYISQVDEDIRRWVHTLYSTEWDDCSQYDIVINAAHLSAENAATALVHFAQLPEFQTTPAARKMLQDLYLGARCRLAIGSDERTRGINVGVRSEKGVVSITYMPRQAREAKAIPDVLESVVGIKSLVSTMATTNILCIGEKFNPNEEAFDNLIEISKKWNAAIEMIRLADKDEKPSEEPSVSSTASVIDASRVNGGILDDSDRQDANSNDLKYGVYDAMHKLIQVGHAGGSRTVYGGTDVLLEVLPRTGHYSLIAIGDVFSSKGGAQQRIKREMIGKLKDKFRVPVIGTEDLKAHYLFGPRQLAGMIVFAALSVLIYLGLFTFQTPILTFISKGHFDGGLAQKISASVVVAIIIPIVAFIIGGFYSNLLKLLKVE